MQQQRPPVSYKDWLNELNNQTKAEDMLTCAIEVAQRAPDKKTAYHDVCLVLANMYNRKIRLAAGNKIVERNTNNVFDKVTKSLFKKSINEVIQYVIDNEPNFDRQASDNRSSLGYIEPPKGKGGLGYLEN